MIQGQKNAKRQSVKVYGAVVSYYTGKIEGYLRYKEIPYEFVTMSPTLMRRAYRKTGASQMPVVELMDGRMLTDTTPTIAWLESTYPDFPVIPSDPAVAFISQLIEDYAEEWLWRPAMHYRWSYKTDRMHLSRKIVDEIMGEVSLPGIIKRQLIRWRQQIRYVKQDGVSAETWDHVESVYLNTLDRLEAIFSRRPFVMGDRPTIADFGFFASMFRHFSQDPTASEIMRYRAPGVFEWQARLWNARGSKISGELPAVIEPDLSPILDDIGAVYIPFLNANARAWANGKSVFDLDIEGAPYRNVPVSQYRVWCLEQLRSKFEALTGEARETAADCLATHQALDPLFEIKELDSNYLAGKNVPFAGQRVHYQNHLGKD